MESDSLKPRPTPASPNQAGRPKRNTLFGVARHLADQIVPGDGLERTYAEVIVAAMLDRACMGGVPAARLVFEMTEGKTKHPEPPQEIEPPKFNIQFVEAEEGKIKRVDVDGRRHCANPSEAATSDQLTGEDKQE